MAGGRGGRARPPLHRPGRSEIPGVRRVPWLLIGAVVVILSLIGVIAYNLAPRVTERIDAQRFAPSTENPDPSSTIEGVVEAEYAAGNHIGAPQRVAYDQSPPIGGAHDQYWATCTGIVYRTPVRTENIVHSLEHGAVWIAYNPDRVATDDVTALAAKTDGKPYMLMSPYPGLDSAVSLQSWGHQLKLDNPGDERVSQFISALRQNPNTHPEVGATCATMPGAFDPANPPPFDPSAPGPDAVPAAGPPDSSQQGSPMLPATTGGADG